MFNKLFSVFLLCSLLFVTSCSSHSGNDDFANTQSSPLSVYAELKYDISVDYTEEDLSENFGSITSNIVFSQDVITSDTQNVLISENTVTVTTSGVYVFSGNSSNGQILVNSSDNGTVRLVLNGLDLTNQSSAPIYIVNAEKCIITLADGSENILTDNASYIFDNSDNEPNATIFSKDELTINGRGRLTVNANFNNGIQSKDGLKITGGNITVNAVNNAVKGKDFIGINDGNLTVNAKGNGVISDNTEDSALGYILISGGNINVTADGDGIQAETCILITDGNITVLSGGGSQNGETHYDNFGFGGWHGENTGSANDSISAKGIKSGIDISVTGGNISVNSADDALHSNQSISINGGTLALESGDDAIHADSQLNINGSTLSITKCYEGLEAAEININAGNTHIVSTDDGINASLGSSQDGGRGGGFGMMQGDSSVVNFTGGYLYMNAGGDGFDSNGNMNMSGGTLIIDGPTNGGNGAIDYGGKFTMTGGLIIATGSSAMAETVSNTSTQYCLALTFSSKSANTLVHIESQDGTSILTYSPSKKFESVIVCSPDIKKDTTYNIFTGGTCNGNCVDGLYSDGEYNKGTQEFTLTVSSIVTANASTGFGGGMPGGGFGGGRPPEFGGDMPKPR